LTSIELRIEAPTTPGAAKLIAELDAVILDRYPGLPLNGLGDDFEARDGLFVVAYAGREPVACGAFQREGDAAEIKRMYVTPGHRRTGLARRILAFLEDEARRRGYTRAILETGIRQPEAIALYEAQGWTRTAPYGVYVDEPVSVCFEKLLMP